MVIKRAGLRGVDMQLAALLISCSNETILATVVDTLVPNAL